MHTFILSRMEFREAVFPVPGAPETYNDPGLTFCRCSFKKDSISATCFSLHTRVVGVPVFRLWRTALYAVTAFHKRRKNVNYEFKLKSVMSSMLIYNTCKIIYIYLFEVLTIGFAYTHGCILFAVRGACQWEFWYHGGGTTKLQWWHGKFPWSSAWTLGILLV